MAKPMTPAQWRTALRKEGVDFTEGTNWTTHERDDETGLTFGPVNMVLIHHDAGKRDNPGFVRSGSSALPGPLAHAYLSRTGKVTLISAGRANHAGPMAVNAFNSFLNESKTHPKPSRASGTVDGNDRAYGIEIANDGVGEDYPAYQYDQAVRWAAAICRHHKWSEHSVAGHKETSVEGKIDPSFSMTQFRKDVAARLAHDPSWSPDDAPSKPEPKPDPKPQPESPDGFPGPSQFGPGERNKYVTELGKMLVARGGGRYYASGPGPQWTAAADGAATAAFQRAQGWSGADADGIPGAKTWDLLKSGKGKDIGGKPVVSLSRLQAAFRADPSKAQGGTTSAKDVHPVEDALARLGFLDGDWQFDGSAGSATRDAYGAFQRSMGYRGSDADGIPGSASLHELAKRTGLFTVGK